MDDFQIELSRLVQQHFDRRSLTDLIEDLETQTLALRYRLEHAVEHGVPYSVTTKIIN